MSSNPSNEGDQTMTHRDNEAPLRAYLPKSKRHIIIVRGKFATMRITFTEALALADRLVDLCEQDHRRE